MAITVLEYMNTVLEYIENGSLEWIYNENGEPVCTAFKKEVKLKPITDYTRRKRLEKKGQAVLFSE